MTNQPQFHYCYFQYKIMKNSPYDSTICSKKTQWNIRLKRGRNKEQKKIPHAIYYSMSKVLQLENYLYDNYMNVKNINTQSFRINLICQQYQKTCSLKKTTLFYMLLFMPFPLQQEIFIHFRTIFYRYNYFDLNILISELHC